MKIQINTGHNIEGNETHLLTHTLEKLHDERKHRTDPPMDPPIDLPGLTAEK